MMGWGRRGYISRFAEIGPLVPEKKILKGFTLNGTRLGYVTSILLMNIIISLYLKAYTPNLVKNGSEVSVKSKFQFPYVNDRRLGQ